MSTCFIPLYQGKILSPLLFSWRQQGLQVGHHREALCQPTSNHNSIKNNSSKAQVQQILKSLCDDCTSRASVTKSTPRPGLSLRRSAAA